MQTTRRRLGERGVAIVGEISPGLPPMGLPDVDWSNVVAMAGVAVGVMLIGFALITHFGGLVIFLRYTSC